jgi:hypothetical protein
MGGSERHFILGREEKHRLWEGSQASPARPSGNSKSESEGVRISRSSGLRQGPRSFDFKISVYVYNFGDIDSKGA